MDNMMECGMANKKGQEDKEQVTIHVPRLCDSILVDCKSEVEGMEEKEACSDQAVVWNLARRMAKIRHCPPHFFSETMGKSNCLQIK